MKSKLNRSFSAGLLALLFLIYSPVIWEHPTLLLDDRDLLTPLSQVQSLQDYASQLSRNQIVDIQPVRDFTYWLELQVEQVTGYRNSQLVNLFIWTLILAASALLLQSCFPGSPWNPYLLLLLAVHPVATTSVAWIAARKHLLSALFLILATYFSWQRLKSPHWKYGIAIILCFFLSVFSQPISLAWPLWFALLMFRQKNSVKSRDFALLSVLVLISATAAYVNYRYYSGHLFLKNSPDSPPKINEESFRNLLNRILVLGRYTYQMLVPIQPVGLPYRLMQIPSYMGLALLAGLALMQWKFHFFKGRIWVVLMLLPVLVMTVKLTHHAGFDTYILFSLIGGAFLLASSLQGRNLNPLMKVAAIAVISALSLISLGQSRKWTSDYEIFSQAYESEGTLLATTGFTKLLLEKKEMDRAAQLINELAAKDPENRELPGLKGRFLFLLEVPSEQKRALFRENEMAHPWYQYYFAALDASESRYMEAFERILKSWQADPQKFRIAFSGNEKILFTNWRKICELARRPDCQNLITIEQSFQKPD